MEEIQKTINDSLAEKVAKESCILEVHKHEPGFSKTIDSSLLLNGENASVDPKRLSVYKALISNQELKALRLHRDKFFEELKSYSLPGGMLTLGGGQYLIPLSLVSHIKNRLDTYMNERSALLDDFESRYEDIIESAKERLGPLFNQMDYPPFEEIRSRYKTTYKFISNSVPEELARVNKELYEKEKQRIAQESLAVSHLIQEELRNQFLSLVSHLKERLTPDEETGKKKRFHGSNLDKLTSFIEKFKDLNLTGDTQLETLIEQSKALLEGADPDKVRTDEEFREELRKSFEELKENANTLVVTETRRVILED